MLSEQDKKKRGYGNIYFIVVFTTVKRYTHPKRVAGENPANVNNCVSLWLVELWVIFFFFFHIFCIFKIFSKGYKLFSGKNIYRS